MPEIENHPLPQFLPSNAKLLMLGSFPPPHARWSIDFYYPNMQNDMWRIFGVIFFNDKNYFVCNVLPKPIFDKTKIIKFLENKGVALSDTAQKVVRLKNNASDNFLEIVDTLDLSALLEKIPHCSTIATTGKKATETLAQLVGIGELKIGEKVNSIFKNREITFYRMPSSSRAYPMNIDKKADFYKQMFVDLQMI